MPKRIFLVVIAVVALFFPIHDALACGGFFAPRPPSEAELAKNLPFLTVEQVLLVWDEDTQIEDFVREARFDAAKEAFGFVVPVPSKPEVFPVKKAPFDELRKAFPFEPPPPPSSGRGLAGIGGGAGAGAAAAPPPPVEVLSEQKIGSFTAFVLMANDRNGFDKWLGDNGFATTPASSAWLAEYVTLHFYFVAMRYEPTKAKPAKDAASKADAMTSETVRIRFKTPQPYYPYREPEHPTTIAPSRQLTAWLVTKRPMMGVVEKRTEHAHRRPWAEGLSRAVGATQLGATLGELASILPAGPLSVATYRDLKTSRAGYGDIVFVPRTPLKLDAAGIDARRALFSVLEWRLVEPETAPDAGADDAGAPHAPDASPAPSASSSSSPPAKSGCSTSGAGASASGVGSALALAVLVAALRRRRIGVAVAALATAGLACKAPSANADASADASIEASAPELRYVPPPPVVRKPMTPVELEKEAIAILEGDTKTAPIEATEQPGNYKSPVLRGNASVTGTPAAPIANFDRVVAGMRGRMRACYNAGLNSDPNQSGKLTIKASIGANGEVTSAEVKANQGVSPSVASCIAGVLKRAQFDPPATATTATVDVVLDQQR